MKNVLFISIDDLINVVRYRHAYGTPFQTPNIDRLLDMGTYFNGAHALVAECNPSRASVLTGQSLFRTSVEDNSQRFFDLVDPRTTLPTCSGRPGTRPPPSASCSTAGSSPATNEAA